MAKMARKRPAHRSVFEKSTDKLNKEGDRQNQLLLSSTAIAFYRYWGWDKDKINDLMYTIDEVWTECADDIEKSMVEMCEAETGIELQIGDGKSWHDLHFLNSQLDPGRMTGAQWVYMRQQQLKWVAPTILAGILLALHRKYKFGYRRCSQIYAQILDIENEFGMDPMKLKAACLAETEVEIHDRNKYRRKGGE